MHEPFIQNQQIFLLKAVTGRIYLGQLFIFIVGTSFHRCGWSGKVSGMNELLYHVLIPIAFDISVFSEANRRQFVPFRRVLQSNWANPKFPELFQNGSALTVAVIAFFTHHINATAKDLLLLTFLDF